MQMRAWPGSCGVLRTLAASVLVPPLPAGKGMRHIWEFSILRRMRPIYRAQSYAGPSSGYVAPGGGSGRNPGEETGSTLPAPAQSSAAVLRRAHGYASFESRPPDLQCSIHWIEQASQTAAIVCLLPCQDRCCQCSLCGCRDCDPGALQATRWRILAPGGYALLNLLK
jgi:hypothetical protein